MNWQYWSLNVYPRCAEPRHALPLRPADPSRPAGGAAAAGATLAHAHPELLDAGGAGHALHQLAARPAVQLPCPPGVPRQDDLVSDRGRSDRRNGGAQSVRFLSGAVGGALPVQIRPRARGRARALPDSGAGDAQLRRVPGEHPAGEDADQRLPGRAEPEVATRHRLSRADGAGRANARGDAGQGERVVPRHGVVAGAAAAPPRSGGAFRVRLPDSAQERRQVAGRPERHRGRLHRPARLVRGVFARGGLDRSGSDLRAARRRRPHSAGMLAGAVVRSAGERRDRRMRDRVRAFDVGRPRVGSTPGDAAVHRSAMVGHQRAGSSGGRRVAGQRRAPDAGRRADLRVGRRPRGRRVEHRGHGPDQAAAQCGPDGQAAAQIRPGRAAALRPGQVVPG